MNHLVIGIAIAVSFIIVPLIAKAFIENWRNNRIIWNGSSAMGC